MPYSLVSAATLGFDLVRLPAGRSIADVLLAGLGSDTESLRQIAATHPARRLEGAPGEHAVRSRRARELAAALPRLRDGGAVDGPDRAGRLTVLVTQLERSTIGDARTVEWLLRNDVLHPEQAAVAASDREVVADAADVLADAAVGYWAAAVLPTSLRRELTDPFDSVQSDLRALDVDGGPDLGPGARQLRNLLGALERLDETGRACWRAAADAGRTGHRSWASAMHEASWAAYLSGRTRALAAAQMYAVRAFVDGGFQARDGAHGIWNAVAGCVQATATADLLDDRSLAVLQAPWRRATGPRSLD
jgi:hypothetical protein